MQKRGVHSKDEATTQIVYAAGPARLLQLLLERSIHYCHFLVAKVASYSMVIIA